MKTKYDPNFINLDVVITSKVDLTPVIQFFGDRVFVLCNNDLRDNGYYWTLLEAGSYRIKWSPERYIQFFLDLFDTIPTNLKKIWNRRKSLSFDIGIESGIVPPPYPVKPGRRFNVYYSSISHKTLHKIAELKGDVTITVYPYDQTDRERCCKAPR
jgi:hypothetical protein